MNILKYLNKYDSKNKLELLFSISNLIHAYGIQMYPVTFVFKYFYTSISM